MSHQSDFDFLIGDWSVHNRRLNNPLTGSASWYEFEATSKARSIWDGLANMDEYVGNGPAGLVHGITVRLFDPATKYWRLYWANQKDGFFGLPMIGSFKGGRGDFYDQELFNGKAVFVRFVWIAGTVTCRWEQAFSPDGGETWETNWIMEFSRA